MGDVTTPGAQLFDVEFLRYLIQQSIGVAFAAFMFMFYRKDMKEGSERWKVQAEREDRRTEALIVLVEKNTTATTTNTEVLRALHRRVDDLDLLKVVNPEHAAEEQQRRQ